MDLSTSTVLVKKSTRTSAGEQEYQQLLVDWSTSTAAGEQEYQAAGGEKEY